MRSQNAAAKYVHLRMWGLGGPFLLRVSSFTHGQVLYSRALRRAANKLSLAADSLAAEDTRGLFTPMYSIP